MALTGSKQPLRMLEVDRTQASTPELRDAIVLRRAMRDLLVLCTIPAAWTGREPDAIAKGVVDVLVTALRVECGYLVLKGDPADIKTMQGTAPPEVIEALLSKCAGELPRAPLVHDLCHAHRAAIVPIRVAAKSGFVAAISSRVDFPTETESMLMSVAANQAAISLEAAHLRTQAEVERRRLQELMAQAPAAMALMYGPEHRYTYVNDYYLRVTGRTSETDFIGKTLEESLPETETAVFRKLLDDVYQTGNPYVGREMKATLNREGQAVEVYFDFVYQAIRDSAGKIEGVLVHAVDVTDKVLARRTIAESEERLRLAQGAAQIGTWEWDAAEGKNKLSPELHHMFATNTEDSDRVRVWAERVHPDDWGRVQQLMQEGYRQGEMEFEYHYRNPDLGTRWFYCKGRRIGDETRMLGIVQDVTERKTVEEALRRSEEEFRALANAIPQLVWMANPDGWIFWYNQRWYEYTGTRPEQMEGWGWESVHDPAVLPAVLVRWKDSIASGEPFEMTFPIRGSDGKFRPFLTRVVPIRDQQGAVTRWFGTNTDISEEVSARQELRANQERLQTALVASQRLAAIVESSDDAIVSKNLKGIVTSWNSCAERTFGYKAEEIIGKPITIIIPTELQDDENRILATIARGERIEHFETVRRKKNGELIDVSLTISPIKDEQGKVIGAAKIARDITQRKRTEKALQMTEKLASVGRLAATVAHELNNPLEAVTNFIFLAQTTDNLPEPAKEYLTLADRELERVSHIAQQTLGFYRDTSARSVVDIRESLDDVLRVFESKFRYKSLKTELNVERGLKIEALGGEVRQVFSNLISNAIDASPTRSVIKIHAKTIIKRGSPYAQIAFADHGSGIPDGVKSNIFTPFFTTKSDVGTGLGLWVSKSLVEKHGGRIAFRSKQGKGTVFTLQFPLRAPNHDKEH